MRRHVPLAALLACAAFATPATAAERPRYEREYAAKFAELRDRHGVRSAGCYLLGPRYDNECAGKASRARVRESIRVLDRMLYVPPPPKPASAPAAAAPSSGGYSPPATSADTSSTGTSWDSVAQCESSGNWSTNTGNGYYGGLQFDSQTWDAYGNPAYGEAHEAPASEQIAAAERLPYDGWPNC